jgi:hypothetical protein
MKAFRAIRQRFQSIKRRTQSLIENAEMVFNLKLSAHRFKGNLEWTNLNMNQIVEMLQLIKLKQDFQGSSAFLLILLAKANFVLNVKNQWRKEALSKTFN